jgi:steroid delta-isomerase-like uncharacterized protein
MSEENTAVVHRYVEQFWNEGRVDLFKEIVAADGISHSTQGDADFEGWKQGVTMLRNAFPDLHITVEDEIAGDSRVVQRWTLSGTHEGEFIGIPASGKRVSWPVIAIFRLSGDKLAESWTQGDTLSLLQQLGASPVPGE